MAVLEPEPDRVPTLNYAARPQSLSATTILVRLAVTLLSVCLILVGGVMLVGGIIGFWQFVIFRNSAMRGLGLFIAVALAACGILLITMSQRWMARAFRPRG